MQYHERQLTHDTFLFYLAFSIMTSHGRWVVVGPSRYSSALLIQDQSMANIPNVLRLALEAVVGQTIEVTLLLSLALAAIAGVGLIPDVAELLDAEALVVRVVPCSVTV